MFLSPVPNISTGELMQQFDVATVLPMPATPPLWRLEFQFKSHDAMTSQHLKWNGFHLPVRVIIKKYLYKHSNTIKHHMNHTVQLLTGANSAICPGGPFMFSQPFEYASSGGVYGLPLYMRS